MRATDSGALLADQLLNFGRETPALRKLSLLQAGVTREMARAGAAQFGLLPYRRRGPAAARDRTSES